MWRFRTSENRLIPHKSETVDVYVYNDRHTFISTTNTVQMAKKIFNDPNAIGMPL